VNSTTIGTQVAAGIESVITNMLIPALLAGIPTLTMTKPKINSITAIATRGFPSNPVPPLLGPNESISDFIMELPQTSSKIPRVGTWNENILPPEVKERCNATRNVNSILTCALINSLYHCPVNDGTTRIAPGSTIVPVIQVSKA
jgi:hypothetical protein